MAEVRWIKLNTDIFENRKIRQIESLPDGDSIVVLWLKLLCLAGSVNDRGAIYLTPEVPYTDQMLATYFNRPLATIQLALKIFEQFGMIDVIDDVISILNWEKYQNAEKLEALKEQNRKRVAAFREKQKLLEEKTDDVTQASRKSNAESNVTNNVTVTLHERYSNATDIDKELDKEKDIEKNKDVFVEFAGDNDELLNALKGFEDMRKHIKSALTENAKKLLIKKLERDFKPDEWVAVIEQSTFKGWKDIYPLKGKGDKAPESGSPNWVGGMPKIEKDWDAIMARAKERAQYIGKKEMM